MTIVLISSDHFFGNRNLTPLPATTERDLARLLAEIQTASNTNEAAVALVTNTRDTITNADSPYTVPTGINLVGVDCSGGAVEVDLPAAADYDEGQTIIIKDESGDANTNNITADGDGAEEIDGATTKVLATASGSMQFYSNGVDAWFSI
jgi:hypothetical protein